eukprot:scaffold7422_cov134-Isochrysis_galbana.AAC.1
MYCTVTVYRPCTVENDSTRAVQQYTHSTCHAHAQYTNTNEYSETVTVLLVTQVFLSTCTKQGYPPSPHSTKRLSSSSPTLSTTTSLNMTSHNTQPTDHDKIPPLKQSASANDTRSESRKREKLKTTTDANAPWGHSGQWEP